MEKERIKVIIMDGVVNTVLANEAAIKQNLKVEVINFDSDMDDEQILHEELGDPELQPIVFTLNGDQVI